MGASVCPEPVESANGEAKQINKPAVNTVEDLISDYVVPYVVEALSLESWKRFRLSDLEPPRCRFS
jgi:hypothetical protein